MVRFLNFTENGYNFVDKSTYLTKGNLIQKDLVFAFSRNEYSR